MNLRYNIARTSLFVAVASLALAATAQTTAAPAAPTAKDKTAMEAAFTRADTNADGKLSKDEAARMPAITAKFDELDTNKDGSLTMDEFATGYMSAS